MKKCPVCGSVTMDQDNSCGVCGSDLAGIGTIDESSLEQPVAQTHNSERRRLNKTALVMVLAGPVLSLLGLVLLLNLLNIGSELIALSGIAILILGLLTTMGTIGAGPSLRSWLKYKTRVGRFADEYGSHDPRPHEVEVEERQTSVEIEGEDFQTREERKKEGFD